MLDGRMKMFLSFIMTILQIILWNPFLSLICQSKLYKLLVYYSNDTELLKKLLENCL